MVPDRVDVVVVGAGPVGCALSLLLGTRQRSVLVVERHSGPYPLPRAVHFDDETARILQTCGLGEDLPALSEPATTYEWRNGEGVPLLRFEMPAQGQQGWPSANMFNQPDLEARLFDRVEATEGLSLLWSHAAVDAGQDADGAWVEIEPADGSTRRRVERVLRRGLRRCQQHGARPGRSDLRRPGFLLRLAGRRRRAARAAGLRPPEPPGVRPPPAHDRRLGWPGPAALGVHVPPRRVPRDARRGGRGVGVPRTMGRPSRQRHDDPPRRVPLPRPVGNEVARGADLRGRGRRPPDTPLCRPGHVRRPARRRQPGLEARLRAGPSGGGGAPRDLRDRAHPPSGRRDRGGHRARTCDLHPRRGRGSCPGRADGTARPARRQHAGATDAGHRRAAFSPTPRWRASSSSKPPSGPGLQRDVSTTSSAQGGTW